MDTSLYIFRRDFRIKDNTGLIEACKNSKAVYPIFIFTPEQISNNTFKSSNAVQFMVQSLKELNKELDNKLNLFYGNIEDVITEINKNVKINAIYTNTDYTPYAIKRDEKLDNLSKKNNIKFLALDDILVFKPGAVLNNSGTFYQKFTPFYRKCMTMNLPKVNKYSLSKNKLSKIGSSKYLIDWKETDKYYTYNDALNVDGGRENALKILKDIKQFKTYEDTRNLLKLETTQLSGYIKFGCISIREVLNVFIKEFGKGSPLVRQLIWRDFYYHLGNGFLDRFGKSTKIKYDNIKWLKNETNLEKWKRGETGYPVIDAAMMQINTTGYMHNRARMLVASFLIKNLGIDWREGEKYFAQTLLDYDVLVNQGNWQWVSGSGADSQQYIRVFNPWIQSERYDKECEYIKKWLPSLKDIPAKHLHQWNIYHKEYDLKKINYVKPIVDYKDSKEKIIKLYKNALQ